jgi:hypothetical protein
MGMMDNVMADDAAATFDIDGFDETVTYHPHNGTSHALNAIVLRRMPRNIAEGRARSPELIVMIPIAVAPAGRPTINTTVDQIELPRVVGGTAEKIPVAQILASSGGRWKLRLA